MITSFSALLSFSPFIFLFTVLRTILFTASRVAPLAAEPAATPPTPAVATAAGPSTANKAEPVIAAVILAIAEGANCPVVDIA